MSQKRDLQTLRDCVKTNNIQQIIGTSLGGYYGLILSQEFTNLKYHLINPSYKPYSSLIRFLNTTVKNYKKGETFYVNNQFLKELEEIKPTLIGVPINNIYFYFGIQDEILNFDELLEDLKCLETPLNYYKEQQNHRFPDISIVLNNIKEPINLDGIKF